MTLFDWLLRGDSPTVSPDQRASATAVPSRRDAFDTPVGDFRFIALDVETACSDAASICQIGLACVLPDNRIQTFATLVNPGTRFDPFNIRLHGIGPDHVSGAPRFGDVLEQLFPLLLRHHLVQHSNFDKQAVNAACHACGMPPPDFRWADSVVIARRAWPELKGNGGHGLGNLKKVLNLQFRHYDASEDARAAAKVALHAEAHLRLPFDAMTRPASRRRHPPAITKEGDPAGALSGASVVFTGALSISRTDAANLAAGVGMAVKATMTKQITHLVVGDHDLMVLAGHLKSSKHRKAEEMQSGGHPIRIMGETEFRALVAGGG